MMLTIGSGARAATRAEIANLPAIMRSVDQIMVAAERDVFFVEFGWMSGRDHPARKRHFDWFGANGLRSEPAAPRGWLEGDPGLYAVRFDGPDDPRVARYAAEFEDVGGESLDAENHQMCRLDHASWLTKRGADAGEDGLDDDGDP